MAMDESIVKQRILSSIKQLIKRDNYLLKYDVSERAIAHRLAIYIERKFKGWNVDCEYNRDRHDEEVVTKSLPRYLLDEAERDATKEKSVVPDIIIHHRGISNADNNLLAIEIKKTSNCNRDRDNFDYLKLMAFKSELDYNYILFLKLNTGNQFNENHRDLKNASLEWNPHGIINCYQ